MIESASYYFDYLRFNNEGTTSVGAEVIEVLVTSVKRTASRVLVLVVSMGYGVIVARLGTAKYKVLLLGGLYFVFTGIHALVEILERTQVLNLLAVLFVFPLALLDTAFYWWIFLALVRAIAQLQNRKQPIKLAMYNRFFYVLLVSVILSTIATLYQLFVKLASNEDAMWRTWWIWNAFWQGLYLVVMTAIAVLWRPTSNNTRYAYSEVATEDDVSGVALHPIGFVMGISQRTIMPDSPEAAVAPVTLAIKEATILASLADTARQTPFSIEQDDPDTKTD